MKSIVKMLKSSTILTAQTKRIIAREGLARSKHSYEAGLKLPSYGLKSPRSGFHQSQVQEYPATKPLPLPSNIQDLASIEKLIFSPQRTRDINGSFISLSFDDNKNSPEDERIQCYDCSGAVSLSSAMQTNVPFPFTSKGKPTHLNMPGGQWGQNEKYMSGDLNAFHHSNLYTRNGGTCDNVVKTNNNNYYIFSRDYTFTSSLHGRFNNRIQLRNYSNEKSSGKVVNESIGNAENTSQVSQLSRKEKLKAAIKDYGAVVIVFHITISLVSLGCCYLLVASGVDLSSVLKSWGPSEGAATAGIAAQFVIAYAIHKSLAPGRIAITLSAVPFVVRKLRKMGWLKPPAPKPQ